MNGKEVDEILQMIAGETERQLLEQDDIVIGDLVYRPVDVGEYPFEGLMGAKGFTLLLCKLGINKEVIRRHGIVFVIEEKPGIKRLGMAIKKVIRILNN